MILIFISTALAEMPSGYLMRDISEIGNGWASSLRWLPGESTAVWIEVPPNNPHLSRLVEWDGDFKRTIIPAGVREIACGLVEDRNLILSSILIPDSANWENLGLELYSERGASRILDLPSGTIPGLASWDCSSDTIWFALCFNTDKTPVRFFKTFGSEAMQTERPLPPGARFPIGTLPSDTSGPCLRALFPEPEPQIEDETEDIFMAGIIPNSNIDFIVENGRMTLIENGDTLVIDPKNCARILDIAWRSNGSFALVSIFGNPSRISLLELVWPNANH